MSNGHHFLCYSRAGACKTFIPCDMAIVNHWDHPVAATWVQLEDCAMGWTYEQGDSAVLSFVGEGWSGIDGWLSQSSQIMGI